MDTVYVHYNNADGTILGAYHQSCLPDIPEPTVTTPEDTWTAAVVQNRERHVDITQDPPALVIGDPIPPDPPVERYSKLSLIRRLRQEPEPDANGNLWDVVKAFIDQAGAQDEWQAAAWLASDDPLFTAMKAELLQRYPQLDIDAILRDCIYTDN